MSSSYERDVAGQYVDFDEYIDYQLKKTRSNIRATDVLTACTGFAALTLGYLLIFTLLDHWVIDGGFSRTARIWMFVLLLLVGAFWFVRKILLPYLKRVNNLYAARTIEEAAPELGSSLLNLVDLNRANREVAPAIRTAMEKRAAVTISHMDVEQAVDRRQLMRYSYAVLAVVAICCLYTFLSPKQISIWRPLFPTSDVDVATRTEIFDVEPGDTSVIARSQLIVNANLRGEQPERVFLFYTTSDRRYVDEPVEMRPAGEGVRQFQGLISGENGGGILQDLSYRIEAGDAVTADFDVTVIRPPSATVENIRYDYPDYMQIVGDPRTQPGGRIDAHEGTKVTLTAAANMPVRSAEILFSDSEQTETKAEVIRMEIADGIHLRAEWTLAFRPDGTFPKFYRVQCRSENGDQDPEPTLYQVNIIADQPPDIALLDPTHDLEMPANGTIPLAIQARDPDFQLRSIWLRVAKQGEPIPGEPILDEPRQSLSTSHDLQLAPLRLQSGEEIEFWLEARDNKPPLGNRRNTPRLKVRIIDSVSEEKAKEQLQQEKQRQREKLDDTQQDDEPSAQAPPEDAQGSPAESGSEQAAGHQGSSDESSEGESGEEQLGSESDDSEQPGDAQSGGGDKPDPQGDDFEEALRKFIDQEQQKGSEDNDQPSEDGQQPNDQQGAEPEGEQGDKDGKQPGDIGQKNDSSGLQGDNEKPGDNSGQQGESPNQPKPQNQSNGPGAKRNPPTPDGKQPNNVNPGSENGDGPNDSAQSDPKADGGKTSPSSPKESSGEKRPGQGNDPSQSPDDANAEKSDGPLEGDERPADDADDARRKKATGDESGEATPDENPDANPTEAKGDLKRKPGEKPAMKQPANNGDSNQPPNSSKDRQKPKDGGSAESKNDNDQNRSEEGSPPSNAEKADKNSPKETPNNRTATDEQKNQQSPAGQDSSNPQGSESGKGDQESQGNSEQSTPGQGESSDNPGGSEERDGGSGGQKSEAPGEGEGDPSSKGEGGDSKGSESPESGSGDKSDSPSGEGESGGEGGKGGDSPAGQPNSSGEADAATGTPNGAAGGTQNARGTAGEAGGPHSHQAEEANLEFAKKAANLVLNRLDRQLQRGEVDRKLLDELGWTEKDMKNFADRLRKELGNRGDDNSPESKARQRQFEETLKSLGVKKSRKSRRGTSQRDNAQDGIGARRAPVPTNVRDRFDAYTRSLSKRASGGRSRSLGAKNRKKTTK